jgi:hypothetical protein
VLGSDASIVIGLYIRIFVMQVTIILGAWVALLAGTAGALVLLILVKTAIELSFDKLEDRLLAAGAAAKAEREKQKQQ